MSPRAVTVRLERTEQIRQLCLALGRARRRPSVSRDEKSDRAAKPHAQAPAAAFVFPGSGTGIADGNPITAAAQLESNQTDAHLRPRLRARMAAAARTAAARAAAPPAYGASADVTDD
jgi:hypothetical protein